MRYLMLVALAACKGFFDPKPPDAPPQPPDAPRSTITYVQGNFQNNTGQTTISAVYSLPQHAGDLDVVIIEWSGGAQMSALFDSLTNAYLPATGVQGSSSMEQAIFVAAPIADASFGQNTVTVNFDTAVSFAELRILEYAGLDSASPIDGASTGTGGGNAIADTGSLTTSHAHDLLVATVTSTSPITAITAGYSNRLTTSAGNIVEDVEVFDVGTYDASVTLSGPGTWEAQLVALRAAD